jgi:hypothetical protein
MNQERKEFSILHHHSHKHFFIVTSNAQLAKKMAALLSPTKALVIAYGHQNS